MPTLATRTKRTRRTRGRRKNRRRNNGELEFSLEKFKVVSYEKIKTEIKKKVGKMPPMPKGLPSGVWSEQALKVLSERYLKKGATEEIIETPDEMCWRVAWEIASAEARWSGSRQEVNTLAKDFYHLLVTKKFLPNSPTLMNAGTDNQLQYSGCYVLPVGDSLVEIFDAIKYQALIHQSGGGTGFAFSRLRSRGSHVKSSNGVASGPVSFMKIFDAATNQVKQGGRRRGANMGILRVDHPDILEFIHCKDDGGISNFNISVALTDEFMAALEAGEDYNLIDPRRKTKVGSLSAKQVFNEIAESAWKTGDPGLVFIDRFNKGPANPVPSLGPIESTNPCGEQPLYAYDSCNLGSIFLNYFVTQNKEVDWDGLRQTTRLAIQFMDNVIEVNPYSLEEVRRLTQAIRRIGLGVGGWADMLIDLEIAYDSEEALSLAGKVMEVINDEAIKTSQKLAQKRGPFPFWPISIYKNDSPRRNSTLTTIAPTGSISIIADASSGIEPIFAIAYRHIVKDQSLDRTLTFVNPRFEKVAREQGFWSEELREKVVEKGVIRDFEDIPEAVRWIFGTAHEIHHDWHLKTQAAFQEHVENAVSKTINMRNSVTVDEIKDAYLLAWHSQCQGITVFRDGCKDAQVLNLGLKDKKESAEQKIWSRPVRINGATYKMHTPIGTAYITINHDEENNPIEVFINVGKAGSDVQAMAEALGRIISKSLKFESHLTPTDRALTIIEQLQGIGGRSSVGFGPHRIRSLPEAIAIALSSHFGLKINGNGNNHQIEDANNSTLKQTTVVAEASKAGTIFKQKEVVKGDYCPSCGSTTLIYEEGCSKCHVCGHSEC